MQRLGFRHLKVLANSLDDKISWRRTRHFGLKSPTIKVGELKTCIPERNHLFHRVGYKYYSNKENKNNRDSEESSIELLQGQALIWNRMLNFINSMSLGCALQLGIPEAIHNHGKPMNLAQLINVLPIHQAKAPFVYRLMRILVHSGFFAVKKVGEINHQEEGYALTYASRLLLKDHPSSLAPFVLVLLDPIMNKPWQHLTTWFQNESPSAFYVAHGMNLWEYASHEPKLSKLFNNAMESDSRLVSTVLKSKFKHVFQGMNKFVDVGGGTGTVAKAIADTFPNVECIVLDLPHVVADLQGSKNLKFLGGDMFDAVPSADAILLKWILHDWNDDESTKILVRCKEAITSKGNHKKGKVIIIDMVMSKKDNDDESIETQLFFDMQLMVMFTGKQRSEEEWAKLFFDAGFSNYKITPVLGLRSIIEVYP